MYEDQIASESTMKSGVVTMGPFPEIDEDSLRREMRRFGINLTGPDDATATHLCVHDCTGITLLTSGEAVHGYPLCDEGWEVDEDTMRDFMASVLPEGHQIRVTGSYHATDEVTVQTEMALHVEGRLLERRSVRRLIEEDGESRLLDSCNGAPEAPMLRSVAGL